MTRKAAEVLIPTPLQTQYNFGLLLTVLSTHRRNTLDPLLSSNDDDNHRKRLTTQHRT